MLAIVVRVTVLASLALAAVAPASAQSSAQTKLEGVINDFSDLASASGPWQILVEWSAVLKGSSGKADFVGSIAMIRTPNGGSPHTHHVALLDGTVTPLAGGTGFVISGEAAITSNGAPAGFTGSRINVEISGDPATVPAANVKLTFLDGAVGHFGAAALDGVVTVGLP